jgi:hypothetical protein
MNKKLILLIVLVQVCALSAMSQMRDPAATVAAFYRFSDARSDIFNRRHIESRKQWYTTRLYNAFWRQLREDREYLKNNPTDKPFFGDGLDFEPLHESCEAAGRSYKWKRSFGKAEVKGSTARVDVTFAYPPVCKIEPTRYRMKLQKVSGRWLVDDLIYPDGATLIGDMNSHRY